VVREAPRIHDPLVEATLPDLSRQVMLVTVGAERAGLVVGEVTAVLEQARLSAVPKAPAGVLGIMNHVGSVVTVVSLAAVLAMPEAPALSGAAPFVVVVERRDDRIGLRVDRVEGITLTVDLDQHVRPAPEERLCRGWLAYEGREIRLIDGGAVVDEVLARFERRERRA
jgi:purine-binding chemotaxis protein CheW